MDRDRQTERYANAAAIVYAKAVGRASKAMKDAADRIRTTDPDTAKLLDDARPDLDDMTAEIESLCDGPPDPVNQSCPVLMPA